MVFAKFIVTFSLIYLLNNIYGIQMEGLGATTSSLALGNSNKIRHTRNAVEESPNKEIPRKYCGLRLHSAIELVCKNQYYAPHSKGYGKRSAISEGAFHRFRRYSESRVTEECCKNSCTETDMLKYCGLPITVEEPETITIEPDRFTLFDIIHAFIENNRPNSASKASHSSSLDSRENSITARLIEPRAAEVAAAGRSSIPLNIVQDRKDGSIYSLSLLRGK